MKKILLIAVIGILLLSGMEVAALKNDGVVSKKMENRDFTHTVFVELATTTWCGYCHYAREALDAVYTSGDFPFFYVSMIGDKNTHAAARNTEYNVYGYPTVYFDGGYNISLGGGSDNEEEYRQVIPQSGERAVADIDTAVNVVWLGDATMDITVLVKNNEANAYAGHLHVYVTEIESSLNWVDTTGHAYTFPFLDYAFNQGINIAAGDTWENSVIWDGHDYDNGYGVDFGSIQNGNIAVIATVFNNTWHQGYSYPPDNPFDAYYVDESAGFILAYTGPYVPSDPSPADGATDVDINSDLRWTGGGTPGLTITYDVYFGTTGSPLKVASNQSSTSYDPGTLDYSTSYYWIIMAWDQNHNPVSGEIWGFTTTNNPNNPPDKPTITGARKGKVGTTYTYTITGTDPDSDNVYGFVDWGDDTTTDWVGPYITGEAFSITHTWDVRGTYSVRVKIKDEHGSESDWETLQVKMPTSYNIPMQGFLDRLLERFPTAFPLLRQVLKY